MAARAPSRAVPHTASASIPCATRPRSLRPCRASSWSRTWSLLGLPNKPSVGDLCAAHQRRLLDIVVCENLLQVLDLRNVVVGNIGLVRVQRQVVLMIGLRRIKSLQRSDLGHDRLVGDCRGVWWGGVWGGNLS